jgi:hypothetical protein
MFFDLKLLLYYIQPFLSFIKKTLIVGVTFFIVLKLFFYFANVGKMKNQSFDPVKHERDKYYSLVTDKELKNNPEAQQTFAFAQSILCPTVGELCDKNKKEGNFQNSYLGFLTNMIVLPYQAPIASGTEWARTGLQDAGFIPKSEAAIGIGLAAISPFKDLWLLFRNFSFLLMVLVMIAIGFMIMFRTKINAQTVISLENALPKIVIAMILITFSYAIAGLMIDLMYISIGLIIQLFSANASAPFDANAFTNQVFFSDQFSILWNLWGVSGGTYNQGRGVNLWAVTEAMYELVPTEIRTIAETAVTMFSYKLLLWAAAAATSAIFGKGSTWADRFAEGQTKILNPRTAARGFTTLFKSLGLTEGIFKVISDKDPGVPAVAPIAGIVVLILDFILPVLLGPIIIKFIILLMFYLSLFFIFARIFAMFIGAYIQIILLVIFSPVILLMEMVPGRSAFASWIKSLFINLLTFPLFVVVLLLSKAIMSSVPYDPRFFDASSSAISAARTTPVWGPPFLFGLNAEAFSAIIGGALLFMAPDLIKMFKEMTGIKPIQQTNLKLGSFFLGATALVGGTMGIAGQYHSIAGTFLGAQNAHLGFNKIPWIGPWVSKFRKDTQLGEDGRTPQGAATTGK